jgi:hypothetical protein
MSLQPQFRVRTSEYNTVDLKDLSFSIYNILQSTIQNQINSSLTGAESNDFYETVSSNTGNNDSLFSSKLSSLSAGVYTGIYSPTGSTVISPFGTTVVVSSTSPYFLPAVYYDTGFGLITESNLSPGSKKTVKLQDARAGNAYITLGTSYYGQLGIITPYGGQFGQLILSPTQPSANLTFNGNIWQPDNLTNMTTSGNLVKTFQPFNSTIFSYYGYDVATDGSGKWNIIGAPGITGQLGGSVFVNSPTGFSTLITGLFNNNMGQSVESNINATTIVAGAPGITGVNNTGAVYVYNGNPELGYNQIFSSTGPIYYGYYNGLSANGNTLAVGSPSNSSVYVYNLTTTTGSLLQVLTSGSNLFGYSVAIAGDSSTIAVGTPNDNLGTGSVSIYNLNASGTYSYSQNLVGLGGIGAQAQGSSLSLSGDGSTLAVGSPNDAGLVGSTYIFQRTNTVLNTSYTQQARLIGSGSVGTPVNQGYDVTLSGDGNSLSVDAPQSSTGIGAVFLFSRPANSTNWKQVALETPFSGTAIRSQFGFSVALNSNGSSLIVGSPFDNSGLGTSYQIF